MKTIKISDELYNSLIELSYKYRTQNNRGQANPLYFQIEDEKYVIANDADYDKYCFCDCEGNEICKTSYIEYFLDFENEDMIREWEVIKEYDIDTFEVYNFIRNFLPNYKECYFKKDKTYTNAFLLAETCEEHIAMNKYHYSENARSYANTFYRNHDMDIIIALLLELNFN